MEPDFWTSGWLGRSFPFGPSRGRRQRAHALLFDRFGHFHCEAPMYARENDSDHCHDAPVRLLAGWHERGGDSILVNGRPIEQQHRRPDRPPPAAGLAGAAAVRHARLPRRTEGKDVRQPLHDGLGRARHGRGRRRRGPRLGGARESTPCTRSTSSAFRGGRSVAATGSEPDGRLARQRHRHVLRQAGGGDGVVARPQPGPGAVVRKRVPRNDEGNNVVEGAWGRRADGAGRGAFERDADVPGRAAVDPARQAGAVRVRSAGRSGRSSTTQLPVRRQWTVP